MSDETKKRTTGTSSASRRRKLKGKPIREYGPWEVEPELVRPEVRELRVAHPEMTAMTTRYEGSITYLRFWNF